MNCEGECPKCGWIKDIRETNCERCGMSDKRKFDLQRALAGAPIRTKKGISVTGLHQFPGYPERVFGVFLNYVRSWDLSGKWLSGVDSSDDLEMVPVQCRGWAHTSFLRREEEFTPPAQHLHQYCKVEWEE
jgi:hypothetical protein